MEPLNAATAARPEQFRDYLVLLARLHWDPRLWRKIDPEDLAQKTLSEAVEHAAQFRGTTPEELKSWLRQILRNNLLDARRELERDKRDVHREASLDAALANTTRRLDAWLTAEQTSPSQHAARGEDLEKLAGALRRLDDAQRDAVELHHLQGWPLADIAAFMGRHEGAVAGLIHRGLSKLRELMVIHGRD